MNILTRLLLVFFGIIGLAFFVYGFKSLDMQSDGQLLKALSAVPASLMLLTAAFYTKKREDEVIYMMLMFLGVFFALLTLGMHKQSGAPLFGIIAWLSIMLCGTAAMMVLGTISSCTNCKICTGVRATGVHIGIPHRCSEHQHN